MEERFLSRLGLEKKTSEQIQFIQPLVLAYIGDVVYEVYIRNYIIHRYSGSVNHLHRISTKFVKAGAQSKIVHALESFFSEEEWTMIKRGRNQKSGSTPKNASITDYKYATGFETLIGYLYLIERYERLEEVIHMAVEVIENTQD